MDCLDAWDVAVLCQVYEFREFVLFVHCHELLTENDVGFCDLAFQQGDIIQVT